MDPSPSAGAVLDPFLDPVTLTQRLVNIPSVSGEEQRLADEVEQVLRAAGHLLVERFGNTVVARTDLGLAERVVIGGHLDTVPENANLPSRLEGGVLHGLGSCDMKGGVAVALHLAGTLTRPCRDVTYLFYECEEVDAARNGLTKLGAERPDLLEADFAVLMEPSNGLVEAGCQGTLRAKVTVTGERAHSARAWMGRNAIHESGVLLDRLRGYAPRRPVIDGLEYVEGLNAVAIRGGVAGNVIPDLCELEVNHRFAPDRTPAEAEAFVREFFAPYDVQLTDLAPGALPGLSVPAAADFVAAVGGRVNPKFGWTDVARFSALGVPAVNYGPGDPVLAHKQDERVEVAQIVAVADRLRAWLAANS